MFIDEVKNLKLLNHPNTVKFIESFGDGETGSVIVMEFAKGMTFGKLLDKKYKNEPIPIDAALDYAFQMCECIRYLHCNLFMIHSDYNH